MGWKPKSAEGIPGQKTSEKNVRSKPEGKWSYRQYAGKIRDPRAGFSIKQYQDEQTTPEFNQKKEGERTGK